MRVMKLPKFDLPVLKGLVVIAVVVSLSACSIFRSKHDSLDTMPVDALYNKAHVSLEKSDYAAAGKA